ncbi:hypothetical protein L9F63_000039, partial [Diploptera punctata]
RREAVYSMEPRNSANIYTIFELALLTNLKANLTYERKQRPKIGSVNTIISSEIL